MISARWRHGPRRDSASRRCRVEVNRCCTPARMIARARRGLACQLAKSTRLRATRVRRGRCRGWTSRSSSIVLKCGTTSVFVGRLLPSRRTTCGLASSKPVKPSQPSAVRPASAAPLGHDSNAAQSRCASVSGPLCVTTTPRVGRCQRPVSILPRTVVRPKSATACGAASTPHCSTMTGSGLRSTRVMSAECR